MKINNVILHTSIKVRYSFPVKTKQKKKALNFF